MHASLRAALARIPPSSTPVVLLGSINLVRAIGLAGHPVIVATRDREDPALASRYCRAQLHLEGSDDAMLAALQETGDALRDRHGRRVPLAYGSDDWLRFIHAHRESLQCRYALLLNHPATGVALLDKTLFAELARENGLPAPATLRWETGHADSLATWDRPVVVKPASKSGWGESAILSSLFGGEGKALVLEDGPSALNHAMIGRFRDQLVFQEYIPGADEWCFDGVADAEARLMAGYTGRKLRLFPLGAGDSAYVEMRPEASLEAAARDIAQRLGLRGIFNMDFKRDPRDGSWRLLEINARYNFWLYMSARNGVNLVRVFHDYLLHGKRPGALAAAGRYRWIDFKLDRAAFREMRRRGEITFAAWAWSLAARRKVYSILSWSDPMPFVRMTALRVARRLGWGPRLGKLRNWLSKAS